MAAFTANFFADNRATFCATVVLQGDFIFGAWTENHGNSDPGNRVPPERDVVGGPWAGKNGSFAG